MKNYLLLALTLLSCAILTGQTATSVASGPWLMPTTWSCNCVPTPGYTVVINHNVTLNTSFAYTTGSITINSGGSLLQDTPSRDIWINGGAFNNSGNVGVRFLFMQTGTFSKSGTMTMNAMANYVNFTNTGTIQNVDSLYLTGAVINNGIFLNIDSITTAGTFTNNGVSTYNQFTNSGTYTNNNNLTFTDVTNNGTMTNNDTITALNSGWNQGNLVLASGSYFLVSNGFLNHDLTSEDAVIDNNGRMNVLDSWYNFDTIKGVSGSFIVQDSSVNYGDMKQSFDFCDLTPPSSAPYIDFNFGTVSTGITWCVNTSIAESAYEDMLVYPNPANSVLYLNNNALQGEFTTAIYSLAGAELLTVKNKNEIDITSLSEGLYILTITTNSGTVIRKIEVTR